MSPLPAIRLIRNFLVNVNSDVNTSRRTIENISNKSFVLVC